MTFDDSNSVVQRPVLPNFELVQDLRFCKFQINLIKTVQAIAECPVKPNSPEMKTQNQPNFEHARHSLI